MNKPSLDTLLVHAGEHPRVEGAVCMPIFQSVNYVDDIERKPDDYDAVRYTRLNNTPSQLAVATKLAALEQAEAALVTGSGMAAISATLLTLLRQGDHLLVPKALYGGTFDLVHRDLVALGIESTVIDMQRPDTWQAAVRPTTRLVYSETLSNPLLELPDLPGLAKFARAHGLLAVIDNTFASPINFRPLEWGFHIVVHSATKYLNGHSDVAAGVVAGAQDLVSQVTHKLNHLGGCLDPHACYLLHRGLKTLGLRVRQQNHNAAVLARFLEGHPQVAKVCYPGLKSHPQSGRADILLSGSGGMLSFELHGGVAAAEQLFKTVQLPLIAPSLGGVESLLTRPAVTSHAGMTSQERQAAGIGDGLIRMSVGIESAKDLQLDLAAALDSLPAVGTLPATALPS